MREWLKKLEAAENARQPLRDDLESRVIEVLRNIYDPEIPVNIYDLGLIYELQVLPDEHRVRIRMTLTAPACPVAQEFPQHVARTVGELPDIDTVDVELVWEPPWNKQMMSEAARLELGLL